MSTKPSPLTRNMSPLAAAATEFQIRGTGTMDRTLNTDKGLKCSVRLQGDLVVRYKVRTAGGPLLGQLVHEEAPRRFDQSFDLHDPDTFFRSYSACRDAIHQMLMQTPVLCEFDLGADNWNPFLPHDLATTNVDFFRRDTVRLGGVALRYSVDMALTIWADILYDEPRAMLLACMLQDAAVVPRMMMTTDCGVCMEDLTAQEDTARLPCSHSFHRECIMPWFYKAATCPMCRHDVSKCLAAVTDTPKGKFPGLKHP